MTPEQEARVEIDALLEAAGWKVQDKEELNLSAGRGIAVREFHIKGGFADYLLYGDKKVLGTIEAKKAGELLLGVETQSDDYAEGFTKTAAKKKIPYWSLPLPFHYESTGKQTNFANRLDPNHAPRRVFAFHRPETLIEVVKSGETLRKKLQNMPPLNPEGLRKNQIRAVPAIEDSFKHNRLRTLTPQIMGSGKTILAVAQAARLLQYAKPEGQMTMRILFLVDRRNLGKQAYDEFSNYVVPGDGRKFGELFNVQRLTSQHIGPSSNVVISTIQRLYAILRDEEDFDEAQEDESVFEQGGDDFTPLDVAYNPSAPIELFDFIFTDEAHRSIYGRWGQVLDYFDSFLVGLTATPSKFTYGYFDGNVVAPYTYEESVIDQINVDYTTYRIKTEVTGKGSSIGKGEYVVVRSKATKEEAYKALEDDITYDQTKLDRAVVAKDQLRTIIKTFRDRVRTEIFPGRSEVPKTVIFCKHEQHAEDVLQIVRDEFGRGSDFARKITYKTHGSTDQLIQDFRTDPKYRVAVTVDQIATGTDIKPVECLLFLRMVQSRSYFEQMKGRGVRKMDPDDFWAVTPGAKEQGATKDHFVIVDCIGLTDEDKAWVDTRPLDRKPQATLSELLDQVAKGSTDGNLLVTVASRLVRLEARLDHDQEQQVIKVAGMSIKEIAKALVRATDPDQVKHAAASAIDEEREPTEDEINATRQELAAAAVTPLYDPKVRETLLSLLTQTEQIIDLTTQDMLIAAGFADKDAKSMTETFEQWIKDHHDEFVALQAYFGTLYKDRPTLKDLKDLSAALEAPPLFLTTDRLWRAYEQLKSDKVKGHGKLATDLVSLIRFVAGDETELIPHSDTVKLRFDIWMAEQEQNGKKFNPTQRGWLMMVRDHIATSLSIEPEDFDLDPFSQEGGLVAAHEVFGEALEPLLDELNQRLAK